VWWWRPAQSFAGVPQASEWQFNNWHRVLRNDGFLVGWSDWRGNPLWVTFRLTPIPEGAARLQRPSRFSHDWRSLNPLNHDTYTGSGYDRGHLAPNYAMSRLYGSTAQQQSFLMSNITPQRPRLNQKLWQRLEELEIDHFAPRFGELWVTTGPIFDDRITRLSSSWLVEIPDAFYRIWVAPGRDGAAPKMLAFLVPQKVRGTEPLTRFVTKVDEIEDLTGLDFFSQLPDALEQQLEGQVASGEWDLAAVANRKPRF